MGNTATYILGINAYHADSSAAIFRDGHLIAATEEERFKRTKHWAGFPEEAIQFCLREAGISVEELDYIAIGRDPKAKFFKKVLFVTSNPGAAFHNIRERFLNSRKVSTLEKEFIRIFPGTNEDHLRSKIRNIEHHRAHLASAFFASPFDEAALLSVDGSGDFTTTMIGHGKGNTIEVLDSVDFPHSLGLFYTSLTQYLGFPHYGDEYKIMGLAPYGKPVYKEKIKQMIRIQPNGLFKLDLSYFNIHQNNIISYSDDHRPVVAPLFSRKVEDMLGKTRQGHEELTQHHKDIATSVQHVTEEVIMHLLGQVQLRTGLTNVCVAGGVAQNSVANGKITSRTKFQNVYIPSAGHDAGLSMGSALYLHNQILKKERVPAIWSAFTGAYYTNEDIENILKKYSLNSRKYSEEELYKRTVDCLVSGGVVGWFQGRAEFGPRALGARSILADPRRGDAKELLNSKIKRRESFRPFAPSILEEYVGEYFEITDRVPFMEKVFPVKEDKRAMIPAVTHVDGTGRLQSVNKDISPRYYALINEFKNTTGVPVLLNTSFNENEPIVNSPEHAIDCFLRTNMDMLVLENWVITRNNI